MGSEMCIRDRIKAREMLRPNGRILVLENVWDGRRVDDLPGRLLYELTSSRALRPLIQRLGSNSAGVGVAYHSQSAWLDLFTRAGLSLVHRPVRYDYGTSSELRQFLLHTRPPRVEAFILRPSV